MGTLMIPEFMLLGQIVKKEDSACALLQTSDAVASAAAEKQKEKHQQRKKDYLNSPSALHKPSLCCINEEPGRDEEDDVLLEDGREPQHADKDDSHCGFSLFGLLSFICPSRK